MTLKGHYALSFKTRASFGAHLENLNEDRLLCQRRRCSAMTLDSGNIRFVRIFAVVLKISVNFPDLCLRPYITYTRTSRFCRYQVKLFCLLQLSTNGCSGDRVVKCGLVVARQAGQRNVIRRVFGIRGKTADLSQTLYIVGILTNKANIIIWYYLVPYRLSTDSKTRDLE